MVSAKREYLRTRPETFGDFHLRIGEPGVRRQNEFAKSRDFRPILTFPSEPGRTHEWLAGAGGFEPRYGGSKLAPPATLRRNDWLSSLIGALLCRLGCGRDAP